MIDRLARTLLVLAITISSAVALEAQGDVGLRGRWNFDFETGGTAIDLSGESNDAILRGGATRDAGKLADGVKLDGTDDRLEVDATPLALNTWGQLTVGGWIRNDVGAAAGTQDIISWWHWDRYPCTNCGFVLTHHTNDQYFFEIANQGTVTGGTVGQAWTHVVGTYDGTTLRLYVDGVEVDSTTTAGGSLPSSTAQLVLGGQDDGTHYFAGTLDDLRIYDRALAPADIVAWMNDSIDETPPPTPTALQATAITETTVQLDWNDSADPESGVSEYRVIRNGEEVAVVVTSELFDVDLTPDTEYSYVVTAVNGSDLSSSATAPLVVSTLADTTPPAVIDHDALPTSITLIFDEPVDPTTASALSHYQIDPAIDIAGVHVDGDRVTLETDPHPSGVTHTLTIVAVEDLAGNPISATAFDYTIDNTQLGLRAHWAFEGAIGSTVVDETGSGHDATVVGNAVADAGRVGGGVKLDGEDDAVTVEAAALALDTWDGITIAAWVRNDIGVGAGTDDIVAWWNWNGYPCTDCSFLLTHHYHGQYFFEISGTSINGGTVSKEWTHVAATWDGAVMRLYINAEMVGFAPRTDPLPTSAGALILGSQADGSNRFDGTIDEVRLYDRALSAGEVETLFELEAVNLPPTVEATASTTFGVAPLFVDFATESEDDDTEPLDHNWNFGDGGSASIETPSHEFDEAGEYTVTVTVTDDEGLTATDTLTITVSPNVDPGPSPFGFRREAVDDAYPGNGRPGWSSSGDIDGDGDLDVIAGGGGVLSWYEAPGWTRHPIEATYDVGGNAGVVLDVDGDGDLDVVSSFYLGAIAWWENPGANDATAPWISHSIDSQVLDFTHDLTHADVDGDGNQELIALIVGDGIWLYDHPTNFSTNGSPVDWLATRILDSIDDPYLGLAVGDLDGDGDSDLVASNAWFECPADPFTPDWTERPVFADAVQNVFVHDVNQDGLLDIVAAEGFVNPDGRVLWAQSLGDPRVDGWIERVVGINLDGPENIWAGDLDADGDTDIATAAMGTSTGPGDNDAKFIVYEGTDQGWIERVVVSGVPSSARIQPCDIDGDGDTDFTADGNADDNITLWVNIGPAGPPPTGPLVHFDFEEGSGTIAGDASGHGNDGVLVDGATWAFDPVRGGTLLLDGFDDAVLIDALQLGLGTWTQLTIAAWVKNDRGAVGETHDIVTWWNWNGYPCTDCAFALTHHHNNGYFFELAGSNVTGGSVSTEWTHVAITHDGGLMTLYVDGTAVAATPHSGALPGSSAQLIVGGQADGSNAFDGELDDLRVYARALSSSEVSALAGE